MKLYNAKLQYTQAGLFQLQCLFEDERGNKAGGIKSSLGATIRVGDTKAVIVRKLRDMADEIES